MDAIHYAETAAGHRRMASYAGSSGERTHWQHEATRFDKLASVARSDPAAARSMYRPTRAYDPMRFDRACTYNLGQIADALRALVDSGMDRDDAIITLAQRISTAMPELDESSIIDTVSRAA